MDRKHPNDAYHRPGIQEWTELTLQGALEWTKLLIAKANWIGPNAHERTRRPLWRTEMDRTHTNEPDDLHGVREWTERIRRNPWRTGIDLTHTNESDDPKGD